MKKLAKSHFDYNNHARSRNSRLCFEEFAKSQLFQYDSSTKTLFLKSFPNYGLDEKGDIDFKNPKPIVSKSEGNYTISINHIISLTDIFPNDKHHLQNSLQSICQLLVVYIPKNNFDELHISSGTCVMTEINQEIYFMSALHVSNAYPLKTYEKLLFINFSIYDIYEELQTFLKKAIEGKKYRWMTKNQFPDFQSDFLRYLKLYYTSEIIIIPAEIDEKFLKFRYEELLKKENENLWIDPKLNLKPSPSFDFLLLQITEEHWKKNTNFLPFLKPFKIDFTKPSFAKNGVLIGYHDVQGNISTSPEEYCFTFQNLPKNLKNLIENHLEISHFIHRNKSLSPFIMEQDSMAIILFKSNTNVGSSGGPLLNNEGELIGFNTGNYYDLESEESIENSDELESFDIENNLEKKENLRNPNTKNFNIGLSVFHPSIQKYFAFSKVSFKNLHLEEEEKKEEDDHNK